jgi:hypothetical protein
MTSASKGEGRAKGMKILPRLDFMLWMPMGIKLLIKIFAIVQYNIKLQVF